MQRSTLCLLFWLVITSVWTLPLLAQQRPVKIWPYPSTATNAMATETIYKLQPDRTMYLRGFDRRGAAAAFHSAGASGWKVSGVFRDFADFAVMVLWDADDFFNHLNMKWLPDFDFTNMVLTFDLDYNDQLQPIDSPKNPWIAWDSLSYIKKDGTSGTVKLLDHAALQAGSFAPAAATWTVTAGAALNPYDQLTFYYLDIPFDSVMGTTTAQYIYYSNNGSHTIRVTGLNRTITAATNTTPIQITTAEAHGLNSYEIVTVDGVLGNTAANGAWFITRIDDYNFTLSSSAGNGTYTSGGKVGLRRQYTYTEGGGESGREVAAGVAASIAADPWAQGTAARGNPIVGASNAGPIVITMTNPHYLATGNSVAISAVGGNTAANGAWIITKVDDYRFSLDGSSGNGTYTSGGTLDKSNNCFFTGRGTDGTEIIIEDVTDYNATVHIFNLGAGSSVQTIINQINQYDWPYEGPAMAIIADNPSGTDIRIRAGRYGTVDTSGTAVSWVSGQKFTAIAAGTPIFIAGVQYTISSVTSATELVLTASAGTQSAVRYLAERGGMDGNMIDVQVRSKNSNLTTSGATAFGAYYQENKQLAGGSSDVTWRITIDFTDLGIDQLRQAWLTLAPKMANSEAYADTEFVLDCTNWSVSDPSSHRALSIANPKKTVRVGSRDARAVRTGTGWTQEVGFYLKGFAQGSSILNDTITVRYHSQYTHKLFLGTALYTDRGVLAVTVDETAYDDLDTYLFAEPAVVSRRQVGLTAGASNTFAAGWHTVELRVKHEKAAASSGYICYFDYLEAAVEDDVQDPEEEYTDASAAIDYGTNHGYSLPPARLLWMFDRLGLKGPMNEYLSVFWWNQRHRVSGTNRQCDVQFGGTWAVGDSVTAAVSGINIPKTLRALDVDAADATVARKVLARSLADRINGQFPGVWAEVVGAGLDTLRVHPRTAIFFFTSSATKSSTSGTITETGNLDPGSEGVWEIDAGATPVINKAAREWHANFYAEVAARGREVVTAVSMELLNPPDDPAGGQVWAARYDSGIGVLTDTGFGTEAQAAITDATNASPIVITAEGHGYRSGDPITIAGVEGNTAANGDWFITVIDADSFSLFGSVGSDDYTTGGLSVRKLKTTHCTFSSDVVDYQKQAFKELATMMDAAGLTPWLQLGEFLWWFFPEKVYTITGVSNAAPIVVTAPGHTFLDGEYILVAGVRGNLAANGTWKVANRTGSTFELEGSVGNGAFVAAPDAVRIPTARGKSMGYYDDDTKAAAVTSLGRALHVFNTQDDADFASHSTDTDFLAARLKAHIDTIMAFVKATYSGAKFELLFADDVNGGQMYSSLDMPWPQGGRINARVNWPAAYQTKAGSGLDRIKMEALSWGATYHNLTKSIESMLFPMTAPNSWSKADYRVLIPWFNGGCNWTLEYLTSKSKGLAPTTFWAFDQLNLFSWPLPLPKNATKADIF
jgi:hypothetical protein